MKRLLVILMIFTVFAGCDIPVTDKEISLEFDDIQIEVGETPASILIEKGYKTIESLGYYELEDIAPDDSLSYFLKNGKESINIVLKNKTGRNASTAECVITKWVVYGNIAQSTKVNGKIIYNASKAEITEWFGEPQSKRDVQGYHCISGESQSQSDRNKQGYYCGHWTYRFKNARLSFRFDNDTDRVVRLDIS